MKDLQIYNMKTKPNILFITEKWPSGDPNNGLTNNYHNLFWSLSHTGLSGDVEVVHYDEIYMEQREHFDEFSEQLITDASPDIIVVSHLGNSHMNPTEKTYKIAKDMGCKLVFTWPDTRDWVYPAIENLYECSDLHVSWCDEGTDPLNDKHMWLWSPEDPGLYFDDEKKIDVSFVGYMHGYDNVRLNHINYIQSSGIDINLSGGKSHKEIEAEDYARSIRTSKINLNFSKCADINTPDQIKGRVYETLASNSLLLESKNDKTSERFIPGVHYIEFDSMENLKDMIQYYLSNESIRMEIAKAGHEFYKKNYSAEVYWKTIFERLGYEV